MADNDQEALIVYSSPAGTTRYVAEVIKATLEGTGGSPKMFDLGKPEDCQKLDAKMNELVDGGCLWIGSPVYTGHAVPPVTDFIAKLPQSKSGCAVPFVTWGAVSSGLALYEMGRQLSDKGYRLAGAAKVAAVHSMMWQVDDPLGRVHPDSADDAKIRVLAENVSAKLKAGSFDPYPVDGLNYQPESVQGAMQAMSIETAKQLFPPLEVDTQLCDQCGECENLCPAQAITFGPYPQIGEHCFLCFNCVRLCEKAAFKIDLSQSEDMLRGMAEEYAEQPLSEIFV